MADGRVIRYVEQEPPHRVVDFTSFRVEPLDGEALSRAKPGLPFEAELSIIGRCQIDSEEVGESVRVTAPISLTRSSDTVALVLGGWLPPVLEAGDDRVCILDKCAIGRILTRFDRERGSGRRGRQPDFLDFFEESPVRLNLILSALEGSDRRLPNADAIRHAILKEVAEIREVLPNARVVPDLARAIAAAQGLASDRARVFPRQQAFLLAVAPLLKDNIGVRRRERVVSGIIEAARREGVDPRHPLFIATLGCAYPSSAPLCRAVLKFRPGFSGADAYNAMCDVGNLSILIGLQAIYPAEQMAFYTADRGLARLWVGLRVSRPRLSGDGGYQADMSPTLDVLDAEAWDVWVRLTGAKITGA
jgi:hypothetical protein